jgi:helicase MOV-10
MLFIFQRPELGSQRASWYNTGEIKRTVDIIISLLAEGASSSPPLQASEIGVMSAFREQVWKIREHLRKEKLSAVDVGTVEGELIFISSANPCIIRWSDYQGREMRVSRLN